MNRPSMLKPTLIGGAIFGFLGAVPFVSAINCACCALIVGGGFLAAYIHSTDCKSSGIGFGAAEGAKIGLLTGVIYTIVNAIFNGVFTILSRAVFGEQNWDEILEQLEAADAPQEWIDLAERAIELFTSPLGPVIGFAVVLVLALIFSTIGGVIGGAAFKYEPTPPAPPVPPAPSVPPAPPTHSNPGGSAPDV